MYDRIFLLIRQVREHQEQVQVEEQDAVVVDSQVVESIWEVVIEEQDGEEEVVVDFGAALDTHRFR